MDHPYDFTQETLRTHLELRLRTAGLRVLSADEDRADPDINPYVLLSVTCLPTENGAGVTLGYAYATELSMQIFQNVRFNGSIEPSELWGSGVYLNVTSTDLTADVQKVVDLALDRLLNEWLAANPQTH